MQPVLFQTVWTDRTKSTVAGGRRPAVTWPANRASSPAGRDPSVWTTPGSVTETRWAVQLGLNILHLDALRLLQAVHTNLVVNVSGITNDGLVSIFLSSLMSLSYIMYFLFLIRRSRLSWAVFVLSLLWSLQNHSCHWFKYLDCLYSKILPYRPCKQLCST